MKILFVGAGGIISYSVSLLCGAIRKDIIQQDIEIWVADGDIVEHKNRLYSNFKLEDVFKNKATVLAERYNVHPVARFITKPNEVKGFDIVVVGTDDGLTRKLVYENAPFWIDLRAKGKEYAMFSSERKEVPPLDLKRERGSCQYTERLNRKHIDYGNLLVAVVGHQQILNKIRNEPVLSEIRGSL